MKSYVFDIEADALINTVVRVWAIVLKDTETNELFSYYGDSLGVGIKKIQEADVLIGHNIICYDIPVLEKIFGIKIKCKVLDTLLLSRMIWPEIGFTADTKKKYNLPSHLIGSYSLEAFGYRVGHHKLEHNEWSQWSPEMQRYCEEDVKVNAKLWDLIKQKMPDQMAIDIETRFQQYIHTQEQHGVYFNVEKALSLQSPLKQRIDEITKELNNIIPAKKIQLKKSVKYQEFNPGSRQQIIQFLCEKYDWKPTVFTDKGNAQLSEEILEALPYPETKLFSEFFKTQKLLAMLSDGDKSWLKFVQDGKIHGRVVTIGAVTGRCTHSSPNLAQIPSPRAFMGKEVRELFYAPAGYKMIGTDASGLELRCFAHYLHPYDGGSYANEVVNGDVHTRNQIAAGLDTRDAAKTFIYALLYGAGDAKLGSIKGVGSQEQLKQIGFTMRHSFMDKVPAYKNLVNNVKLAIQSRGKQLVGIDKRILQIRHEHAALNTLLQNAGAVAVKLATVNFADNMKSRGIEFNPCLHIHDEWEVYTKDSDAEITKQIAVDSIKQAGEELNFKCPLTGESRSGQTWYEVH
jgi:DNA polymerase I-like protein with 3'-5' exonuclease and polymerase domains